MNKENGKVVVFIEALNYMNMQVRMGSFEVFKTHDNANHIGFQFMSFANENSFAVQSIIAQDERAMYNFISQSSNDVKEKTKLFDLFVIRWLIETVHSMHAAHYQKLLRSGKTEQMVVELYSDKTILSSYPGVQSLLTKVLIMLKNGGHYDNASISHLMFDKKTTSINSLTEKYIADNMQGFFSFLVSDNNNYKIDMHNIAYKMLADFGKGVNELARDDMQKFLKENSDINEVYLTCGINHLSIVLDNFQRMQYTSKPNIEPIHTTKLIEGRKIVFHLFPDLHGTPDAYNNLKKYANNNGLKVTSNPKLREYAKKWLEDKMEDSKTSYYYDSYEVAYLICIMKTDNDTANKMKEFNECHNKMMAELQAPSKDTKQMCTDNALREYDWYKDFSLLVCNDYVHTMNKDEL